MMRSLCLRAVFSFALLVSAGAHASNPTLTLDTASSQDLARLDGVSESLAEQIVALRVKRGGQLGSVEALRVLPGITEASLTSLRRGLLVDVRVPPADAVFYASAQDVLASFASEPSVQQVHTWANAYAKTSPELVDKWLAQSRSFAALPQVTAQYRYTRDNGQDYRFYTPSGTVTGPGDAAGLFSLLDRQALDGQSQILARARWDLADLVMSSERVRVINEAQDLVKLRDQVLTEANRLYFERRRLQADVLLNPGRPLPEQVQDHLRLMELTAGLDALTGGAFSAGLTSGSSAR